MPTEPCIRTPSRNAIEHAPKVHLSAVELGLIWVPPVAQFANRLPSSPRTGASALVPKQAPPILLHAFLSAHTQSTGTSQGRKKARLSIGVLPFKFSSAVCHYPKLPSAHEPRLLVQLR